MKARPSFAWDVIPRVTWSSTTGALRATTPIERRGDLVVLIDKSTNGTYVVIDGLPEHFLKRSECILRGKGQILFAASSGIPTRIARSSNLLP